MSIKLFYTGLFGKNKSPENTKELNIEGDCTITNYDTRTDVKPAAYLKVQAKNNSIFVEEGAKSDTTPEVADLSNKKASVLAQVAGLDGDKSTLSLDDILQITQGVKDVLIKKFNQNLPDGEKVTALAVDHNAGVLTVKWKENDVLRIDFKTKNEINSTTKTDKKTQNVQNTNNYNKGTISTFLSLNDDLIKAEATIYTVQRGDSIDGISRKFGFSHNRILLNANPNINPNNLQIGTKINIPARYSVEKLKISSAEDIEKYVGVSAEYIKNVLTVSEGFLAKPYKDDAGYAKKDKSKAPYAIGFGHGGSLPREYFSKGLPEKYKSMKSVPLNSETAKCVTITKAQAYKILAQDLVNAKMEAEAYLGEAFSEAPQSIQDAIVDIVYNKGVSKGLMGKNDNGTNKDTPSKNIKKYLQEEKYGMVAACVEYRTGLDGLNVRNLRRFKHAIRDLSKRQKNIAINNFAYTKIKNNLSKQATKIEVSDIWESI